MGVLVRGEWRQMDRVARLGEFVRHESAFRRFVTAKPRGEFPAEAGRYHLYVSLACPWASRTVVVRKLKHLEDIVGLTVVSPDMLERGWTFEGGSEPLTGSRYIYEIYVAANPNYSGPATVPVLWDKRTRTIVNNESSEIMRMLNSAFAGIAAASPDLYPDALAADIDELNARLYAAFNNGVYKAGFATTQAAYEKAVSPLFEFLDEMDARLAVTRFLFGDRITEADVRMFTTSVRFDLVYYSHFKCNVRQFRDYPNLAGWLRDMYQLPGVAETVDLSQIKRHYYGSQRWVNPTGIIPVGPTVDLTSPANREHL